MLESKLPRIGTTIFTTMSAMAAQHNAINLSQGFPDFSPPAPLLDALKKALGDGKNQYPPMMGIPELRYQITQKVLEMYSAQVDMDSEVTITSGATEALFVAIQTIVHRGDEVIIFDPAYDAYAPAIQLAGGTAIHVSLTTDFHINWQRVRDSISPRTRALVINSPHNPSGSILSESDLEELSHLAEQHDLTLISDEVYEHMVFDGKPHLSLLGHETLRARSFVISSFGKTYHATGWKVGYAIAPPEFTHEFRKIHQYVTFTTHTPTQYAIADYMANHPEHHRELPDFYQTKRDLFLKLMAPSPFKMIPTPGTYFQLADYSDVSDLDDRSFVAHMTKIVGVAAIPISVFYDQPPEQSVVRFCFAKDDATLELAAEKLLRFSLDVRSQNSKREVR
ncbi:MAG: methionine aminotransferase [Candidatus Azotimanducaceae bacterium]|jgi:methionine aminotransferase